MHFSLEVFSKTRTFFSNYIENNTLTVLNTIPKGFNNNIIWNIGHIVVTQQILNYKLSGLPLHVSDTLVSKYMKGTKPESPVTAAEVDEIKALLFSTIEQTKLDYSRNAFANFTPYTPITTGNTLTNIDDALVFALFHEGLHLGVVMSLIRAINQ